MIFLQTENGDGFRMSSSALHLLWTLFLLLLHQFHLRSSGIRSRRLGTTALEDVCFSLFALHNKYSNREMVLIAVVIGMSCISVVVVFQSLSCVGLFGNPVTVAHQAPLSIGFSRQEYWRGFPIPPPGDLPNPEIKPTSPALAGTFFTTEPPGKTFQSPIGSFNSDNWFFSREAGSTSSRTLHYHSFWSFVIAFQLWCLLSFHCQACFHFVLKDGDDSFGRIVLSLYLCVEECMLNWE